VKVSTYNLQICLYKEGGAVASWLQHLTPDREAQTLKAHTICK